MQTANDLPAAKQLPGIEAQLDAFAAAMRSAMCF